MPVEDGCNATPGPFNPLAHLRPDSRDFASDAAMIADAVIIDPPEMESLLNTAN